MKQNKRAKCFLTGAGACAVSCAFVNGEKRFARRSCLRGKPGMSYLFTYSFIQ